MAADFYVPEAAVAAAVASRSSFNLIDPRSAQKLRWFDDGGRVSDRQWRDILGVLRTQAGRVDEGYLDSTAQQVGLADLLARARQDAHLPPEFLS